MQITYNAPAAARKEVEGNAPAGKPEKMYKPLPHKEGEKFTNELFIPLYQPDLWGIYCY